MNDLDRRDNPVEPAPEPEVVPNEPVAPLEVLPSDLPQHTPWITYTILALTVLVYIAQQASAFLYGVDIPAGVGMKINELIARGQFWRLLTPMLLHGDLLHIGFNMYALHVIGPNLELYFGRFRFILLYLLSGFSGNVLSLAFTEQNSLGASTAIFGLLAAQGVFVYQNREMFGQGSRAILNRILYLGLINLVIGLQARIDNWGHIGGLLGGLGYAWIAGPLLTWEGLYPRIQLVDRRGATETLAATLVVGVVFGVIVIAVLLLRIS
ncbi:MAG TPA: rhomboid family intramembrane serine protease [Anaerolineales bacterium]|nr:rhomboid family intramembrane serine protease [Anaerolineales bacterium]